MNPKEKALSKAKDGKSKKSYDPLNDMMEWEENGLEPKREKRLFQHLVDTGKAWHLQGTYGRAANDMLESGYIKKPKHNGKGQTDAYGNKMDDYYNRK